MPLTSTLLFPFPSGDPRINLAYSDSRHPLKLGEPQSQAVARVQYALIRLGFPMPNSTDSKASADGGKKGGLDGIYGGETQRVVRTFQARNGLSPDGMVGQQTLDQLDYLLRRLPPG
jgi:peptidoglycan hydrolase-like protein with peptidoglycan-binding domain